MRQGSFRLETLGSYWWFDTFAKQYCRSPKGEKPRAKPEWGDKTAGVVQDFVWHPYESISIVDCIYKSNYGLDLDCCPHLCIQPPEGHFIMAPNVQTEMPLRVSIKC